MPSLISLMSKQSQWLKLKCLIQSAPAPVALNFAVNYRKIMHMNHLSSLFSRSAELRFLSGPSPSGYLKSCLKPLFSCVLVVGLTACSAQLAYRDGQKLLEENKVAEGLQKIKQASTSAPENAQYKISYISQRDAATQKILSRADAELFAAKPDQALQSFREVLAYDPVNERALQGIRLIDASARHEKQISLAQSLFEKKELEAARLKLTAILAENPAFDKARTLLAKINQVTLGDAEGSLAAQYKKPISIQFREAPLRQIFDVISRTSGLNFIFDKDVKSDIRATISLKNSSIELAVYYLLITNQLEQQVVDANTIMIFPNSPAKLKEYQEMVVKTFFLANAEAKVVANTLKTILKSRDVVIDEKLNLVIVRDTKDSIKLAEKLVALQDISEPEVMLEVEVLEVNSSRLQELGVTWPGSVSVAPLNTLANSGLSYSSNISNSSPLYPLTTAAGPLRIGDLRNLSKDNLGLSVPNATIKANVIDGDTNILANPRIRVRNREKAKVHIGEKLPQITATVSQGTGGFASESVTYVDVGLTLHVEPTVYLNNEVGIRVGMIVSNLLGQVATKSGSVGYQIGTREVTTMLQLKDGENQILAGLINNEERSNGNKVPGIGELPLLNRLFGNMKDERRKTEIVLSITPHLIRNIVRPEAVNTEFTAGTESSFRRRPDPVQKLPELNTKPATVPAAFPVDTPATTPAAVSVPAAAAQEKTEVK